MAAANFAFTDVLVDRLRAALDAAGHHEVALRVNEDPDLADIPESMDDSVDDEIEFVLPDGTVLERHVHSGPHGIGLDRLVFDNGGRFEGVEHGQVFGVLDMLDFVEHAAARIVADLAPAGPAVR